MEQHSKWTATILCCLLILLGTIHTTNGAITFRGSNTFQVSTIQPVTFQVTADSDNSDAVVVYSLTSVSPLDVEDNVTIDTTTGLLSVESIVESEAAVGSFILITVTATETNVPSGASGMRTYLATVVDTAVEGNEAPVFNPDNYTFTISENVMEAQEIGMLTVTDDDGFPTLDLSDSNTFRFTPGMATLIVANAERVDFDTMRRYEFTVTATDVLDSSLVSNATVTINLLDYNDLSPVIHNDGERIVVQDNTSAMAELITVDVTDGDQPNTPNSEVTLTIADDDGGPFMIMGHTITTSSSLNGATGEYNITIMAQDGGTPQQTSMAMFTIVVVNTNEYPPVFNISSEISFRENVHDQHTFTVIDDDSGDEQIAMLPVISGEFASYFTITMFDTNEFVLQTAMPLDREERDSFSITLTVSDSAAVMFRQTATVNVTINVTDENDNSPVIEYLIPGMTIPVAEASPSGHFVYRVNATDRDSGTNAELNFTIASVESGSDFPFTIDDMGQINTTRMIGDPVETIFNAIVTVTDGGSPMLSASVRFDITVTEINNHKPVFGNLPINVSIDENTEVGDIVIQDFNVTDDNDGEAGTVNVVLEQSSDFFNLDASSIFLNRGVNYEVRNTYEITLVATDNGDPAQTTSVTVQININDINEFTPQFSQSVYNISGLAFNDTLPGGVYVGDISATDADGFYNMITYSIDNDYNGTFIINSITGEISRTSNESVPAPAAGMYNITVTAEDNGFDLTRSSTALVILLLVDNTNRHSPMLDMEEYIVNVPEDTNPGNIILTVTATDGDDPASPAGQIVNFTITGSDSAYFRIVQNVTNNFIGNVILNTSLDYEVDQMYDFIITATDRGLGSRHNTPAGHVIINVTDVNDNDPVFDPTEYTVSIEENTIPTEPLVTVTATDADSIATGFGAVTYSIEEADGSFIIDNMGQIFVNRSLDREAADTIILSVVATDGGGLTGNANVTITVNDINDNAPVFSMNRYTLTVIEEQMDAVVGSLSANDPDNSQNGVVRYSLRRSTAADYFTINETSGVITTVQAIDREQNPSLTFTVIAEDRGSQRMSSNATVIVSISDINDNAPRFVTPLSGTEFRISENVGAIYNITNTRFHAVDDDLNNNITYRIVGGTGVGIFNIYPTGYIYLARGSLDRESTDLYNLTVEARDDGNMSTNITGTIRVLDINDRLPEFTLNQYPAFVFENIGAGTSIITVSAIDLDADTDNHTVGYGFVPNSGCNSSTEYRNSINESGVDFVINNVTGLITLNSGMLDADIVMPNITLCVATYSSADPTFITDYARVVIIPMDVNEHDPIIEGCASVTINETFNVGAIIITVVGSDQDQDSILHYQILDIANSLQIYNNGSIYLSNPINLQSISFSCGSLKCIPYIVQLFDHPNTSLDTTRSTSCRGFISVRDVDNNAPSFTSSVFNGAVYENASVGDVVKVLQDGRVGTADLDVTATDVNVGFILQYSLVNSSITAFEFDSEINGILQVGAMLDYEAVTEYSFDIIVRDTGGQNSTATVNIRVFDVNDNDPMFDSTEYTVGIEENTIPTEPLVTVTATDADSIATGFGAVTYSIEEADGSFIIDNMGRIFVNRSLDREAADTIILSVVATDGGGLTGCANVTITVNDMNDNAPVFSMNRYTLNVIEEQMDIVVGSVSANDLDNSQNGVVRYSLRQSAAADHFTIDEISGVIATVQAIDREQNPSLTFTVIAEDRGSQRMSSNATVIVLISDINDNAPRFQPLAYNFTVAEESNVGMIIGTVAASDHDSGLNALLTYHIISAMPNGSFFTINNQTGEISILSSLDKEQYSQHELVVVAMDQGLPALTGLATVSIETNIVFGDGGRSSAPIIGGSVGGIAFFFIIIFISCAVILYIRRKKRSQAFDNRMATNFNVNMITNPCYNITKQDDHQYDYVLPHSAQDSILEMHRRGQRCNTSNGATGATNDIATQPCGDVTEFSSDGEDIDENGYSYNSQRAGYYKATGNSHDTDNVTMIPNPSYEVASQGVKLQNNPSYNKITYL